MGRRDVAVNKFPINDYVDLLCTLGCLPEEPMARLSPGTGLRVLNLTFMVCIQTNSPGATLVLGFAGVLRLFLDSYQC